jgi:RNA polymerase sigma-70 factor (ECF subfamily)
MSPVPPDRRPLETRQTLLLRLRPDSPAREVAWEEFHRAYAPIIAGFARKMGAKAQDREDVVQDVMTGLFSASENFRYEPARGRFRGFLKVCTFRAVRKRLGQNVKYQGVRITLIEPEALEIDQAWNDVWEHERLRRALEELREKYQATPDMARTFRAFEQFGLLEHPAPEVAQKLKMSIDGVHQAKSRITRALREKLRDLDETEG